jgi:hypothetical protein
VRGTSRGEAGLAAIEAAGIEPALAEPAQPGAVLELVGDVAAVLWLLGSARGEAEEVAAIHGEKLERVLALLVETPVRRFVYEASGSVDRAVLERGAASVRVAAERWRLPIVVAEPDSGQPVAWVETMLAATLEPAPPAGEAIWLNSDGN